MKTHLNLIRNIQLAVGRHIMDTTERNILTIYPSLKIIGFGLVGTIFFGAFAYLMLTSEWTVASGTDYKTGIIIMWLTLGVFIFLTSACFLMLLSIKTFVLTDKNLVIKRPLLLLRKTIPLDNIKDITKGDFKINPTHDSISLNVYSGDKTVIKLKNGKKIKYNSFEISDYYTFNSELQKILRNGKNKNLAEIDDSVKNIKYEGFEWLILIIVLTFGLVYSIIRQRL